MRARAAASVLALVAALVGIGQPLSASATGATAPTPVVSGNRLIDTRTNAVFVPHGVNWPSFEYACSEGWAYSQDDDTAAAAAAMQSWGINTVRVPLNQNCWLGSDPSDYGTAADVLELVRGTQPIVEAIPDKCRADGNHQPDDRRDHHIDNVIWA